MISSTARKNLLAHIMGERARDLAAVMAPLSENPVYAVPEYVLAGRAAVTEMYQRVLPVLSPELADEYIRALDDPAITSWGENHCVIEYSKAYPLHRGMVVVVHFDGDLVRSENTYFSSSRTFEAAKRGRPLGDIPGAVAIHDH